MVHVAVLVLRAKLPRRLHVSPYCITTFDISPSQLADPTFQRSASALFDTVLSAACGETGEGSDWTLVRSTALALQRIPKMSVESNGSPGTDTMTLRRLEAVVRGEGCGAKETETEAETEGAVMDDTTKAGLVLEDTAAWFPAAEQALLAIFRWAGAIIG